MKRRRLDTGKENLYSLYDTILSAHWVRRCSGKVSDGTSREVEMSAQKILAYHSRKAMNCWLRTNGRWFWTVFCFFFLIGTSCYIYGHMYQVQVVKQFEYILYVLLVSHILTFLHMVKTMHILNRHFGISEFEIVWYVYPRGVPIVDVPIFFFVSTYPFRLHAPAPTLSAVHVPCIFVFYPTIYYLCNTTHFSTSARKIFHLFFTVFDSLWIVVFGVLVYWSFYKRFNYKHYKHHSARL